MSERQPIPITEIVAALERESANTDTDPRWIAAQCLRQITGWEARTLMCAVDTRPVETTAPREEARAVLLVCTSCLREECLPNSGRFVQIDPAKGWDFNTDRGWRCPECVKRTAALDRAALSERAAFEHWYSDEGKSPRAVERSVINGGYRLMQTALAWTAWQAALAANVPPNDEIDCPTCGQSHCDEAAMPEKRLIKDEISEGCEVCALGAVALIAAVRNQINTARSLDKTSVEIPCGIVRKLVDEIERLTTQRNDLVVRIEELRATAPPSESQWQPIETAPKGVKLIAGYRNQSGKWRTVMARYYLPGTLTCDNDNDDCADEDGYAPEGWYEETETHEHIMPTDRPPTHWALQPRAPATKEGGQ